jgi:hypothetical protein
MGSVVNNRLEAITRGTDLLPGLHAEVHDAIWLLARQWQLGELDGADAGSPVTATLVTRYAPLTHWQPAGGQPRPYPGTGPLEELVESDGAALPWRDRVAAGLRLARALRRAGVGAGRLIQAHPLAVPDPAVDPDADPAAHATSAVTPDEVAAVGAVMAGRVPDPDAVAAALDANANALVAAAGGENARAALAAWRTWWAARQPAASGAWQPTDLSYALSAAAADATLPIYRAERFGGGTLDWTAFDVAPPAGDPLTATAAKTPPPTPTTSAAGSAGAAGAAATAGAAGAGGPAGPAVPAPVTTRAIPVPVTFHGSPVGRYWQLEDAQTDLGALDTYPTELGKLLLAEFTACFAGDWYRLPVRVPYGSAVRVEALVSTDTFGVATLVPAANAAAGARPWRMYEHSNAGGPAAGPAAAADGSWLLVPPVLAGSMDSAPVEEVVLARDSAADLVWGIEHIVTNAVGRPVRRSEDLLAQGRVPAPDPRDSLPDTWVWRLATTVPENWIPLLPTRGRADNADYLLIQGAMVRYSRAADGTLTSIPVLPASLQLRPGITLPEREVPREGVTLRRTRRLARWVDGGRVQWWARQRSVGHGQSSSGLAYDGLYPTSQDSTALGE